MIYLDASVLVSIILSDSHTIEARAWLTRQHTALIVSDLANLEVSAVVSRNFRAGQLTKSQVESALLDLDAFRASCEPLNHTVDDFLLAERIVRDLATKLAAPDALHVASAKNLGADLATFDVRQKEAAKGLGVALAIPE